MYTDGLSHKRHFTTCCTAWKQLLIAWIFNIFNTTINKAKRGEKHHKKCWTQYIKFPERVDLRTQSQGYLIELLQRRKVSFEWGPDQLTQKARGMERGELKGRRQRGRRQAEDKCYLSFVWIAIHQFTCVRWCRCESCAKRRRACIPGRRREENKTIM